MATSIRLRPWQRAAFEKFTASDQADFLAVATPGAGKTTFALACARAVLAELRCRVVVVAPTAHLKVQWAAAAERFGLQLDTDWSASNGRLPNDVHGIVTTYQQVATSAEALRTIAHDGFVIFDEIHHAGDDKAWGTSVVTAFAGAKRRLSISGTPFRSDTAAIPFVNYHLDEATSDYEYGYGDALTDGGVVRPVYFPRIDGHMEWTAPTGDIYSASFQDDLARDRSAERLRTALSAEGDWLSTVLQEAHDRLLRIRVSQPIAAGLVIATDQEHARSIAQIMRNRLNVMAEVVTSDDPTASNRIARFANSTAPWIIAVRMVSEGVDIPRLRVGVYATTTSTELFFRQAVGRFVRWMPGVRNQKAYVYIPDDPRLRTHAFQIADQRRHSLRRKDEDEDGFRKEADPAALDDMPGEAEQMSLFAVLSAVATETTVHAVGAEWDDDPDPPEPTGLEGLDDLMIDLDPVPFPGSQVGLPDGRNRREERERLRDANADLARALVARTGLTHAKVNAEMNRLAGVKKVTEATLEQLERRLRYGESWLRRSKPGPSR